jgi:hypothetical protein
MDLTNIYNNQQGNPMERTNMSVQNNAWLGLLRYTNPGLNY